MIGIILIWNYIRNPPQDFSKPHLALDTVSSWTQHLSVITPALKPKQNTNSYSPYYSRFPTLSLGDHRKGSMTIEAGKTTEEVIVKFYSYGSKRTPPASLTITAPPATSLIREAKIVNQCIVDNNAWVKGETHTKGHQTQVHRRGQAFRMQCHRDPMHKSHTSEGISPDHTRKS